MKLYRLDRGLFWFAVFVLVCLKDFGALLALVIYDHVCEENGL